MNAILPILDQHRHRATLDEVMRLVELGVFEHPSRIELIDGVILDMAAEGAEHGEVKMKIADQIYDQLDPAKHRR